jgi:hypothetical protein
MRSVESVRGNCDAHRFITRAGLSSFGLASHGRPCSAAPPPKGRMHVWVAWRRTDGEETP